MLVQFSLVVGMTVQYSKNKKMLKLVKKKKVFIQKMQIVDYILRCSHLWNTIIFKLSNTNNMNSHNSTCFIFYLTAVHSHIL